MCSSILQILYIVKNYYFVFYEKEFTSFRCIFPIILASMQLTLALLVFRKDTPKQLYKSKLDDEGLSIITMIYFTEEERDQEIGRISQILNKKRGSCLALATKMNFLKFIQALVLMAIEGAQEFFISGEYDFSESTKNDYIKTIVFLIMVNLIQISASIFIIGSTLYFNLRNKNEIFIFYRNSYISHCKYT